MSSGNEKHCSTAATLTALLAFRCFMHSCFVNQSSKMGCSLKNGKKKRWPFDWAEILPLVEALPIFKWPHYKKGEFLIFFFFHLLMCFLLFLKKQHEERKLLFWLGSKTTVRINSHLKLPISSPIFWQGQLLWFKPVHAHISSVSLFFTHSA